MDCSENKHTYMRREKNILYPSTYNHLLKIRSTRSVTHFVHTKLHTENAVRSLNVIYDHHNQLTSSKTQHACRRRRHRYNRTNASVATMPKIR